MKNVFWFLLTAFLCLGIISCNDKNNGGDWKLVWEENFDGDELDYTTWTKIPRGYSDWNNYMSDYDSLYEIKNGNLVLWGMKNDVLPNDTAPFITGGVYSKGKKAFGNGRLEIKAKLYGAMGAWPAFWMLPEDRNWPDGGEIDIMERLNYDNIAYQTIHTNFTLSKKTGGPKNSSTGEINPDDYNIYVVEKYADSLRFFINDTHTFTYPMIDTEETEQFPFNDNDFYLLLDMQLGGSWVGAVDSTTLPVKMEIDWVRFYEKSW